MAVDYTTTALIEKVRLFENITAAGTVYTDQEILDYLNVDLESTIIPIIRKCREDYLVVTKDYEFSANATNSQIEIPNTSASLTLRSVYALDSQGNFYNVPWLSPEEAAAMNGYNYPQNAYYQFQGFYLQGNYLQLFPAMSSQGATIRLTFQRKPNKLILESEGAKIISVNSNIVTVDNPNPDWNASTRFCFIRGNVPFEFVESTATPKVNYASYTPLDNVAASAVNGQDITVASSVAADLEVGQYVAESGTAQVVQFIPEDGYNLLAQAAALRILRALNDVEAQRGTFAAFKQMKDDFIASITPRVTAKSKKTNSIGRSIGFFGRRGYRSF